ncbi:11450_t:CDS:2 [Entrophospora sp. SA101]|nr:11450_t:CDS:2 [Entrophospora sp. SA101]
MAKRAEKEKEKKEARQHLYRLALRHLVNKKRVEFRQGKKKSKVLSKLFDNLGKRYQERPGGYSRIIKLGQRQGDNSLRAFLPLAQAKDSLKELNIQLSPNTIKQIQQATNYQQLATARNAEIKKHLQQNLNSLAVVNSPKEIIQPPTKERII